MKYNSKNAEHFDTEPYAKITDDEAADLLSQDQIDHLLESIEKIIERLKQSARF